MDKELILEHIVVGEIDTNCYVLAAKGCAQAVVIDPGAEAQSINSVLARNGLKLNSIILTHGHYDHIGALDCFDVPVYIHADDLDFLRNSAKNLSVNFGIDREFKGKANVLKDGDVLNLCGLSFSVIHTPGHTPGGICLKVGALLFSGDTLFRNGIGRTDLPGGSSQQISRSIKEKLFTLNDETIVFPGHGPATTIKEEKEGNIFL